jgi:hypothetical protein
MPAYSRRSSPRRLARHRTSAVDVELRPLAVEFGLRDVATVCQPGEVGEALTEHGRDKRGHSI